MPALEKISDTKIKDFQNAWEQHQRRNSAKNISFVEIGSLGEILILAYILLPYSGITKFVVIFGILIFLLILKIVIHMVKSGLNPSLLCPACGQSVFETNPMFRSTKDVRADDMPTKCPHVMTIYCLCFQKTFHI